MPERLKWDEDSKRIYEAGTSNGVLFVGKNEGGYGEGVAWNGLIAVKQAPEGAESKEEYANNKGYIVMTTAEKFKGNIEAFTYPDEFMECDGRKEVIKGMTLSGQSRKSFALVYSTLVGNDTQGIDYGEKMHFIYGAKCSPSSRDYTTINDGDIEALRLTWDFSTTKQEISEDLKSKGFRPTAHVELDLTKLDAGKAKAIKDKVYGTSEAASKMPTIDELLNLIQ